MNSFFIGTLRKLHKFYFKKISYVSRFQYGRFIQSLNWGWIIAANLASPGRSYTRIKYSRYNLPWRSVARPKSHLDFTISANDSVCCKKAVGLLRSYGVVIVSDVFNAEKITTLRKEYELEKFVKNSEVPSNSYYISEPLPLKDICVDFWLNSLIMKIMTNYTNGNLYARNYPYLFYTNPKNGISSKASHDGQEYGSIAFQWHLDHSTIIQPAVFLEDQEDDQGTCMQVLPGTHMLLSPAFGLLSDESAINSKYKPISCLGKAGSVLIHCGNIYHRCRPMPNKPRLEIKFEFTSGPNILFDLKSISKSLSSGYDLDSLSDEKRRVLGGIYPISRFKGYDYDGYNLTPTKFKGV
ncbi:Phytanoyl-CoA dioxygenase [Burkholderiaceae bacterium]